jgi:hypothetical protein
MGQSITYRLAGRPAEFVEQCLGVLRMPRPGVEPGLEVPETVSRLFTTGRSGTQRATFQGFLLYTAITSAVQRRGVAHSTGKVTGKVMGDAQRFSHPLPLVKPSGDEGFLAHLVPTLPANAGRLSKYDEPTERLNHNARSLRCRWCSGKHFATQRLYT